MVHRIATWATIAVMSVLPSVIIHLWKGQGVLNVCMGVALGLLVLGVGFLMSRLVVNFARIRLAERIEAVFRREYRNEIAIGTHDDIVKTWNDIRDETVKVIRDAPFRLPFLGEFSRWRLDSVRRRLNSISSRTAKSCRAAPQFVI